MSLYCKLNSIAVDNWRYYKNMPFSRYKESIEKPLDFIESYFYCAGKNEFLYQSLFDFNQIDNDKQIERAKHTVNTFFLGLYLKDAIDFLKPHENSFLAKGNNFTWAWFLCSLYHDSFFDINEEIYPNYSFAKYSKDLIHNESLIKKYFEKEKDITTSHNGQINYDHGIVAAEKIFCNYNNMINATLKQNNKQREDLLKGEDFEHCGLRINKSTFIAMCKIAKIIACHNIFVLNEHATAKEKAQYFKLPELIKGNEKVKYMRNTKNSYEISSYEKLYFLLALVDTLEPTKRWIDLKDIDIQIDRIQKSEYDIKIDIFTNSGDQDKYIKGIIGLKSWLNFIDVDDDGKTIYIDFQNNRNHLQIAQMNT